MTSFPPAEASVGEKTCRLRRVVAHGDSTASVRETLGGTVKIAQARKGDCAGPGRKGGVSVMPGFRRPGGEHFVPRGDSSGIFVAIEKHGGSRIEKSRMRCGGRREKSV